MLFSQIIGQQYGELRKGHELIDKWFQQKREQGIYFQKTTFYYESALIDYIPVVVSWKNKSEVKGEYQEPDHENKLRRGMSSGV